MLLKKVLPVIVIAQFMCTSLWFAGNAVLPDLVASMHLAPGFLAHITSAVQFGFIAGTLVFALLAIADRFSPSLVFFTSALLGAAFNVAVSIPGVDVGGLLALRFLTGFFLAGIYPVGMKIASDYFQKGLGSSLGFLVGALVVGTAFPHLLRSLSSTLPWKYVMYSTSVLAVIGGMIVLLFVPDGPYRKRGQALQFSAFFSGFRQKNFRSAAFGYFGHMWELYGFYAFVPVMLSAWSAQFPGREIDIPFLSFAIIASGGIACILAGQLSLKFPARKVAMILLATSCTCCLLSPLLLAGSSLWIFLLFLFVWGMSVVGDSPLFSSLVALHAPETYRGTSLTIVNCIGFSITIVSIQTLNLLSHYISTQYLFVCLAAGPLLGLRALYQNPEVQTVETIS